MITTKELTSNYLLKDFYHDTGDSTPQWLVTVYQNLAITTGVLMAGMIPWCLHNYNVPPRYLRYCSLFGAGLLAGVAMVDIIPEGTGIIFNDKTAIAADTRTTPTKPQIIGSSILAGFFMLLLVDKLLGSHVQKGSNIGIGLIIHAATDGVALAASNWSGSRSLGIVVFLGIFFHKMPVAFGLTSTIIMQEGVTKRRTLVILAIFAVAAPIGSFVTLAILRAFGAKSTGVLPGIMLLFSAGTVLYVALCHIIPEVFSAGDCEHSHEHGHGGDDEELVSSNGESGIVGSCKKLAPPMEVVVLSCGLLLPLIIVFSIPAS